MEMGDVTNHRHPVSDSWTRYYPAGVSRIGPSRYGVSERRAKLVREHAYRRPQLQRKVLAYLHKRVDEGDRYFKSRRLANLEEFSEYEAGAIGRALASLEGSGDHVFELERFSEASCITWRVVRVEDDGT